MNPDLEEIQSALGADNPERLGRAVDDLAARMARADPEEARSTAIEALRLLRRRRQFRNMLRVSEGAFRAGVESAAVSRFYAQALIEEGILGAALAVLADARQVAADEEEAAEVEGLIGRVHKQRYVESPDSAGAEGHLRAAIRAYRTSYDAAPEARRWQGINAVALLARARRDGRLPDERTDWEAMARRILASIGPRPSDNAGAWDAATGAEAHVALGDYLSAAGWLGAYTRHAGGDAFEYAGTLRQLRQVWQIDESDPDQRMLVDLLEASLLRAEGGRLEVDAGERARQIDADDAHLEAVLGEDEYKTIQWYRKGLEAAKSVVRIVLPLGTTVGTGFVVPGDVLHPSWADRSVVLTNWHVANRAAIQPGRSHRDLRVVFEDNGVEVPIRDILWESPAVAVGTNPPASLDATVLELESGPLPAPVYQPSPGPPPGVGKRVYVIGYPRGQALAFSLQDNKVLAGTPALLHYRAPTRPGSSGSPVFDEEWHLVGIHHGGAPSLARLDDPAATYAANEGMLLSAIRTQLGTEVS
ncbi:MAG TPA: serine protease [Acidimicrobiales bacterium]|nr:serine protease [Acidimicrobiales bacterium]